MKELKRLLKRYSFYASGIARSHSIQGIDMRQFMKQIEQELKETESESVMDCKEGKH